MCCFCSMVLRCLYCDSRMVKGFICERCNEFRCKSCNKLGKALNSMGYCLNCIKCNEQMRAITGKPLFDTWHPRLTVDGVEYKFDYE